MEDNFITWLDSLGSHPFGSWLAIIMGACAVIGSIFYTLRKAKKSYDTNVQDNLIREQQDSQFHESMNELSVSVKELRTELSSMDERHNNQIQELTDKLKNVLDNIEADKTKNHERDVAFETQIKSYEAAISNISTKMTLMEQNTTLLIESDKESIKSFIVEKYEQAMKNGFIEPHVLETVELRYEKYLQENGNSFVRQLMEKLRNLPPDKKS